MTWSAFIAAVLGVVSAAMLHDDRHGGPTPTDPQDPPDGEEP